MNREQKLTQVLVDLAHVLGTDFSIQVILDHLVDRILDVLPVNGAGVMLMGDDGGLHFVASTDDTIRRIEVLQNELNEGPCLAAWSTGEPVSIPDLRSDLLFPSFSPRAIAEGMAAVFTFPLRLDEHRVGALDLYRDIPGPLTAHGKRAGQVLADVAAAYLLNARARHNARSRDVSVGRLAQLHDPLTGLPTGAMIADLLGSAVQRARGSLRIVGVVLVDLEDFGAINNRFGAPVGDLLLKAIPKRLRLVLRSGDVVARKSDQHFVIICEGLTDHLAAERVASRVADALRHPFNLAGHHVEPKVSVGLAHSGVDEDVPESLLGAADLAVSRAKLAGGDEHRGSQPALAAAVRIGDGPGAPA